MGKAFANVPTHDYRPRWKDLDKFERVENAPDDLRWSPMTGCGTAADTRFTVLRSFGDYYRLIRDRNTGEVVYFKRKVEDAPATPKEKIDEEPKREGQVRYRVGARAWLVVDGRWFCIEVVARTGLSRETHGEPQRITVKSVTGWDADKLTAWPYGDLLEFPALPSNHLFTQLRPLRDRYV